jgi:hypothetical protein
MWDYCGMDRTRRACARPSRIAELAEFWSDVGPGAQRELTSRWKAGRVADFSSWAS